MSWQAARTHKEDSLEKKGSYMNLNAGVAKLWEQGLEADI